MRPVGFRYPIAPAGMGTMAHKREKAAALDKGLKGMFRAIEDRPLPDRLRSVVDQLDEGAPPAKAQKRA